MRRVYGSALVLAAFISAPQTTVAQGQTETSRTVTGGGIAIPGWMGKIDANEEKAGKTLSDAKLSKEGTGMKVTTGPSVTYWNPTGARQGSVRFAYLSPQERGEGEVVSSALLRCQNFKFANALTPMPCIKTSSLL